MKKYVYRLLSVTFLMSMITPATYAQTLILEPQWLVLEVSQFLPAKEVLGMKAAFGLVSSGRFESEHFNELFEGANGNLICLETANDDGDWGVFMDNSVPGMSSFMMIQEQSICDQLKSATKFRIQVDRDDSDQRIGVVTGIEVIEKSSAEE